GNAEVCPSHQKGNDAADGRDRDVSHNQHRPFERFEHRVKNDEDDEDGNRQYDEQPRVGPLLTGVFSLPFEVIAGRQFHLASHLVDRFFYRAPKLAAAHAIFDRDIALVALSIDLRTTISHLNLTELRERDTFS